jgi:hypothetical protein
VGQAVEDACPVDFGEENYARDRKKFEGRPSRIVPLTPLAVPLVIADGCHHLCASYLYDENVEVAYRIVDRIAG